jgi:hypothetical protein
MSEASIEAKVRLLARDYGESFQAQVVGDGSSLRYDLPESNIDSTTFSAYIVNGHVASSLPLLLNRLTSNLVLSAGTLGSLGPTEYFLDARAGTITVGAPVGQNTVLTATGNGQLVTLQTDISAFVEIAFDIHIANRYPPPTIDTLPVVEEYLVALLAYREILWAEIAQAAEEVDINTPEGMHIPEGQRFSQLLQLIGQIEAHYKELSSLMGVGLYAIQMSTLRRVSRTTNRLVPLYVPQEFDDHSPPLRVMPPIDPGGPVVTP